MQTAAERLDLRVVVPVRLLGPGRQWDIGRIIIGYVFIKSISNIKSITIVLA